MLKYFLYNEITLKNNKMKIKIKKKIEKEKLLNQNSYLFIEIYTKIINGILCTKEVIVKQKKKVSRTHIFRLQG